MFALSKYEHLVVFPVHPATLANYRKRFRPSGVKGDPHDGKLLLDILVRHRERLRQLDPDTPETRTLQFLVEERRKFRPGQNPPLAAADEPSQTYFPQVLSLFADISSEIAGRFLERWPTLERSQMVKVKTLERFFVDHNSRRREKIQTRIEEIQRAIPATVLSHTR